MNFVIELHDSLESTNALAKKRAEEGAAEGLVICADFQTAGYGKLKREWISPAGKNLLLSLLIRPSLSVSEAPMLTQLTSRSIAQVLKADYQIDAVFKRPNDILVQGKKICGILVESASQAHGALQYAVIGIGLNVNASALELIETATSMKEVLGHDSDLNLLRDAVLKQLGQDLDALYAAL